MINLYSCLLGLPLYQVKLCSSQKCLTNFDRVVYSNFMEIGKNSEQTKTHCFFHSFWYHICNNPATLTVGYLFSTILALYHTTFLQSLLIIFFASIFNFRCLQLALCANITLRCFELGYKQLHNSQFGSKLVTKFSLHSMVTVVDVVNINLSFGAK